MTNSTVSKLSAPKSSFNDAKIPVFTNVTSLPETNGDKLRDLLLEQLTSPVRWEEIIRHMIDAGQTAFVEVGPGSVLKGLLRRINRDVSCDLCGTVEQIENIVIRIQASFQMQ